MEKSALKVLFAEDSAPDRLILQTILTQAGFTAIPAKDGSEALSLFEDMGADIVLLDVVMPVMGGMEAARQLRESYQDDLIPILMLTSLEDTESLVACIESGANDYIPKPYNQTVLLSKIKAFARVREMHTTLTEQKKLIEKNNQHLIQEQTVAKQVFDQIAHSGCLDDGYLRYYMSPYAVFNGDIVVADISPSGSLVVLLGDFTGHGLPAAIGSMPLATTFYGMVRKGFAVSDIMREINKKLHEILPVGFFCCATCIDINVEQRRLRYWSGGLPKGSIFHPASHTYSHIESTHMPLGILPPKKFKDDTVRVSLEFGDTIYLWSDGVYEARNALGEMLGEGKLHALLEAYKGAPDLFQKILSTVHEHVGEGVKEDDLSLIEIPFKPIEFKSKHEEVSLSVKQKLGAWQGQFRMEADSLRQFDPLPLLTTLFNEVNGLIPHRSILYTIIAELYSNALEHGLLGMDSNLKKTPQKFTEFYELRQARLQALESGTITFDFDHRVLNTEAVQGGILSIRVRDSGPGFGVEQDCVIEKSTSDQHDRLPGLENDRYFGRGFTLMESVCEKIRIRAPGNDVEIEFLWHEHDQ